MKTVCIFSGGLDSTCLAYYYKYQLNRELELITFNYGQRHECEILKAVELAKSLGSHRIVDIRDIKKLLEGSSLTSDIDVPDGYYQSETMKQTIVASRNAIFLSIAWAFASSIGADEVVYGAHAGDHFIYPDCRPLFVRLMERALGAGSEDHIKEKLKLEAPFVRLSKKDIIEIGSRYNVPFEKTWTCYKGDPNGNGKHCGTCGSCMERKEAFQLAKIEDPTSYEK